MPSRVFLFDDPPAPATFQSAGSRADIESQLPRLSLRMSIALILGLSVALWLLLVAAILLLW